MTPLGAAVVVDLVTIQIRRYATILAATRAAQAKSQESADTMDVVK